MEPVMDILTYLPEFKEHLSILMGRRDGTIRRYVRTVEKFREWLMNRGAGGNSSVLRATEITRAHVEAWLKDLFYHQGNLKNVSRATKLAAIKAFWRFLEDQGVITGSPLKNIPSPRVQRSMPQKFSTLQLRRIFSAPDQGTPIGLRDIAVLKLLYGAGPRVDEIRCLDVGDLHQSGPDIYIHFHETKGGKERLVRLRKNPSAALMHWLTIRPEFVEGDNSSLFVSMAHNTRGWRLSVKTYNSILKRYAALMGITNERVFVHKMRSTFATDLYDLGCGLLEISLLMGHTSIETTQRYIAVSETALKKTAITAKRWKELERNEEILP